MNRKQTTCPLRLLASLAAASITLFSIQAKAETLKSEICVKEQSSSAGIDFSQQTIVTARIDTQLNNVGFTLVNEETGARHFFEAKEKQNPDAHIMTPGFYRYETQNGLKITSGTLGSELNDQVVEVRTNQILHFNIVMSGSQPEKQNEDSNLSYECVFANAELLNGFVAYMDTLSLFQVTNNTSAPDHANELAAEELVLALRFVRPFVDFKNSSGGFVSGAVLEFQKQHFSERFILPKGVYEIESVVKEPFVMIESNHWLTSEEDILKVGSPLDVFFNKTKSNFTVCNLNLDSCPIVVANPIPVP